MRLLDAVIYGILSVGDHLTEIKANGRRACAASIPQERAQQTSESAFKKIRCHEGIAFFWRQA
jgi:hypothetical protein